MADWQVGWRAGGLAGGRKDGARDDEDGIGEEKGETRTCLASVGNKAVTGGKLAQAQARSKVQRKDGRKGNKKTGREREKSKPGVRFGALLPSLAKSHESETDDDNERYLWIWR